MCHFHLSPTKIIILLIHKPHSLLKIIENVRRVTDFWCSQAKFRKMVDDNKTFATRMDGDLGQEDSELSDANRRLEELAVGADTSPPNGQPSKIPPSPPPRLHVPAAVAAPPPATTTANSNAAQNAAPPEEPQPGCSSATDAHSASVASNGENL
jgi:hypothetical protein